jgi:hypothetical protein
MDKLRVGSHTTTSDMLAFLDLIHEINITVVSIAGKLGLLVRAIDIIFP